MNVLSKLQNRDNARRFSQNYFDNLAEWIDGDSPSGNPVDIHITERGHIIACDSADEIAFLNYLKENHVVKDVRGQSLKIPYENAFGNVKMYSPDIAVLTNENQIAIFEVKSLTAMSYHSNMEKYRGLEAYCKEKGFMYAMIAPATNYMSYEELKYKELRSDQALEDLFETCSGIDSPYESTPFKYEDVKLWYQKYGNGLSMNEFKIEVHSLILFYEWYNCYKNGFCVYSKPIKFESLL